MILDTIDHAASYCAIHPRFKLAFDYLRQPGLATLVPGKYEIDGTDLYATVMRKEGKKREDAALEIHREYVDVQFTVEGIDTIGWKAAEACTTVKSAYDEAKDIAFYDDEPVSWVQVLPGSFAIFFPGDAHAPMVSSGLVHKVVVKVRV